MFSAGDGVHVDFGKSYKDSSDKRLTNTAEGRGGQIAVIHHNSQTRSENHVSFNNAEVTEVMALDVASSELLEDKAEETRTPISSLQKTGELEELIVGGSETLLGECLIPAEATLLAEICRARVAHLGERKKAPVDVYPSKGNEMGLQEEVKAPASREVVMAMKIWQQERDALQKAIERGVKAQFSDKELWPLVMFGFWQRLLGEIDMTVKTVWLFPLQIWDEVLISGKFFWEVCAVIVVFILFVSCRIKSQSSQRVHDVDFSRELWIKLGADAIL